MQRLAQFDVSRQFLGERSKLAAQITFGLVCAAAMIGVREVYDVWFPVSGPFALVYPTVLLATLYGHWQAGLTALTVCFLWAWGFVLPYQGSFYFADPTDPARVGLNAAACVIVLVFAEAFRRAARQTVDQISEAADRRLILLSEIEHRTKNNFALVASLLEIQKRRLGMPELEGPLDDAVGRVRTFADAYSSLAMEQQEGGDVAMGSYLNQLLDRIERAALPSSVKVFREIEDIRLPRETAVAIGLYLNEAVSNCAKYAFPEDRRGTVAVTFHATDTGWRLAIDDDGVGSSAPSGATGGLGSSLMGVFASQAGASHDAGPLARGFRSELASDREMIA